MTLISLVPLIVIAIILVLVVVAVRSGTRGAYDRGDVAAGEPSGIGGWLILPAIALVFSPVANLVAVVQSVPLLDDAGYVAGLRPVLLVEIAGLVALSLAFVFVATRFFRYKRGTPRLFIGLLVANLVFILADAALVGLVLSVPIFDVQTGAALIRALIGAAIWIPYMLQSVRVRNTFVVP